jgi:hypothetical protein
MTLYAIGDIHGQRARLRAAHELVAAQEAATQSDPEDPAELGARNEHQGSSDT